MADDQAPPAPVAELVPPVVPPVAPVVVPPVAPVVEPPPANNIPQPIFDRIDRLTRDKKTAEERATQLEKDLVAARAANPPPGGAPAPVPVPLTAMPVEEIERRANALTAERAFAEKCNTIADAGEAAHQDFPLRIQQLTALQILSPDLINAAMTIGDAHEILYALGGDLTEAAKIAVLAPEAKAIALMRYNDKRKAKAQEAISKAPIPPDSSVGGSSPLESSDPSPQDKSDDWFKKREKQIGIQSGNYS